MSHEYLELTCYIVMTFIYSFSATMTLRHLVMQILSHYKIDSSTFGGLSFCLIRWSKNISIILCLINQNLYIRKLYPSSSFNKRKMGFLNGNLYGYWQNSISFPALPPSSGLLGALQVLDHRAAECGDMGSSIFVTQIQEDTAESRKRL